MRDIQRDRFIAEIQRYEDAINNTKSEYLKRDYQKKLESMELELKEYDRYHNERRS